MASLCTKEIIFKAILYFWCQVTRVAIFNLSTNCTLLLNAFSPRIISVWGCCLSELPHNVSLTCICLSASQNASGVLHVALGCLSLERLLGFVWFVCLYSLIISRLSVCLAQQCLNIFEPVCRSIAVAKSNMTFTTVGWGAAGTVCLNVSLAYWL